VRRDVRWRAALYALLRFVPPARPQLNACIVEPTERDRLASATAGGVPRSRSTGFSASCYPRGVKLAELEAELLKLDAADRARLAEKLLESLEMLSERENEEIWLHEASRRDADLDANPSQGRSAEDVLRDARARFG